MFLAKKDLATVNRRVRYSKFAKPKHCMYMNTVQWDFHTKFRSIRSSNLSELPKESQLISCTSAISQVEK